jgi:hypothetical protein
MLFLEYLQMVFPRQEQRIHNFMALLTRDNGVIFEDDIYRLALAALEDRNIDVPPPIGVTIRLANITPNEASKATRRKPYQANILGRFLEVSFWRELKINAIKTAIEVSPRFRERILRERRVLVNSYEYVALDRTNMDDENFHEEEIEGQVYYINTSAQSASAIVNVLADFCRGTDSSIECF